MFDGNFRRWRDKNILFFPKLNLVLQKCPKCIRFITINAHALRSITKQPRQWRTTARENNSARPCWNKNIPKWNQARTCRACALMVIKRMHFAHFWWIKSNFGQCKIIFPKFNINKSIPPPKKQLTSTNNLIIWIWSSRNAQNECIL